uniref:Uncharacterized protein n=1 Tax=Euglenaformis proxima TaxID=299110 RepID=A0A023HHS1_9EUGL|nr:hypothetical protein FL48_p17 [Euglenaformis proxima]AGL12021.1 hypothetical protein [Euglenaformis proxima]
MPRFEMVNPYFTFEDLDTYLLEKLSKFTNLGDFLLSNFCEQVSFSIFIELRSNKIAKFDTSSLPSKMSLKRENLTNYFSNIMKLDNKFVRTLFLFKLKLRLYYFEFAKDFRKLNLINIFIFSKVISYLFYLKASQGIKQVTYV